MISDKSCSGGKLWVLGVKVGGLLCSGWGGGVSWEVGGI
jgi:hypothetical protein